MAVTPAPLDVSSAAATARRWAHACRDLPEPPSARLLGDALAQPGGLDFTLAFVDEVMRPEDPRVAAAALARLAASPPDFLPAPLALALRGAAAAPRAALPVARRAFRALVGDLVVDVGGPLPRTLRRLRRGGARLNLNLLGEAVLGDDHAQQRLARTRRLLELDGVDHVSIKVSAVLGQRSAWGHADAVDQAVRRLRPLYAAAARAGCFVNLDMEEYRDLHLTLDVFRRLLSLPGLERLDAGIAVQTYLRESDLVLAELDAFARRRAAAGGRPIRVRLVKGANLAMELVTAELRGWPSPVLGSKLDTDASFLSALDRCLRPGAVDRLRIGVASHNVFSLAAAHTLARARGVEAGTELEMLAGMAPRLQRVVGAEVGAPRLYVPLVPAAEYGAAVSYLARRLEENAAPENFMSGASRLGSDPAFLEREEARFLAAAAHSPALAAAWVVQERQQAGPGFRNAADTDTTTPSGAAWADAVRGALPARRLGARTTLDSTITTTAQVSTILDRAAREGGAWSAVPAGQRADVLRAVARSLEAVRRRLVTVACDDAGKLPEQADAEVSEAVDFATYYASLATEVVPGARQLPPRVTVVASPWNFPIAIPLGGVAAALAVGSAVVLKPAPSARRVAAVLAESLWDAGVPRGLLQLAVLDDGPLGRDLITDTRVEQVLLTGSAETAELFRTWRPGLPLLAETSGKNAIIVTPAADLDLAAADLVSSAFGHSGQKCSAASLGILVGSVARSARFLDQLVDAAASLRVGTARDPGAQVGPLTEEPGEKLLRGLTQLEPGQRWLLEPHLLGERLWRPGIRAGVRPGSEFHRVEYFGPVLGLMAAPDLATAIAWANDTAFGLTSGIHSLDPTEVQEWLDGVRAGNLYVNRPITGAIVRRQPFGGWKRSVVGPSAKAGGPNHLAALGTWVPTPVAVDPDAHPTDARLARLQREAAAVLDGDALARLGTVLSGDEREARARFGALHDPSGLVAEVNVLRYRPATVTVRVEDATADAVLREAGAAVALGAAASFSFRGEPAGHLRRVLESVGLPVSVEHDAAFDAVAVGRIRYLGSRDVSVALGRRIDVTVFAGPSLVPLRLAGLAYVLEQSVSITAHRFGHPSPLVSQLRLGGLP